MSVMAVRFRCLPLVEKRWPEYAPQVVLPVARQKIVFIMMWPFLAVRAVMPMPESLTPEHIALLVVAAVRLACLPMAVTVATAHTIPKGMAVTPEREIRPPEKVVMVWLLRSLVAIGVEIVVIRARHMAVAAVAASPMRQPTNRALPALRDTCASPMWLPFWM